MGQLSGKVALVTGASAGLGAATARLFAERGAQVFGIARDTERMAEVFADVPGGTFASVDITSPQACADAVADCVAHFGRLDVLANDIDDDGGINHFHQSDGNRGTKKEHLRRFDSPSINGSKANVVHGLNHSERKTRVISNVKRRNQSIKINVQ